MQLTRSVTSDLNSGPGGGIMQIKGVSLLWALGGLLFFVVAWLSDKNIARIMNVVAGILFLLVALRFQRKSGQTS